jgi:hypothetical protein
MGDFVHGKSAKAANVPDNTSRKPPMTFETFDGFFPHLCSEGWPLEKILGMNFRNFRNVSGMISS